MQKALALLQQGQLDKAEKQYKAILKQHPSHPDALHLFGIVANRKGRTQQAINAIKKAISINPDISGYHFNLGVILQGAGMSLEAVSAYEKALTLQPENAEAWDNLGGVLQQLDHYQAAIEAHRKAVDIKPSQPSIWSNLGESYRKQGLFNDAISCYQKALELEPGNSSASTNLGNLYKETGQIDKALEIFAFALHKDKNNESGLAEVHWNQALAFLMQGRFREGWLEYEWGLKDSLRTIPSYPLPVWDGSDLTDKHLLLVAEQGVGDEIMFSSCFKEIVSRAKKVTIECDPRLATLFKRSFPIVEIYLRSKNGTAEISKMGIDCQLAIGSLPKFYRNHESSFSAHAGYLTTDSYKQKNWEQRFRQLGGSLKVGISWKGGKDKEVRKKRSTLLTENWLSLLKVRGVNFINLQYGDCSEELQEAERQLDIKIYDWDDADPLIDLDNFAAQVAALDLVISIDNSTVHMAGSLGIPTWTLLPYSADWRWQRDRSDTPWYPSVRLLRQSAIGDWNTVFKVATKQLQSLVKGEIEPDARMSEYLSKAIVINDTSAWYHWGCTCTSSAIIEQLQDQGFSVSTIPTNELYDCKNAPQQIEDFDSNIFCQAFIDGNEFIIQRISEADIVVINGEGTLHDLSAVAMTLLYIAYVAKLGLNKPVHIINHSCYPENSAEITDILKNGLYKKVYQQMDSVAVREIVSASLLEQLGINVVHSFDCLPLYIQRHRIKPEKNKTKNIVIAGSVSWDKSRLPILADFMQKMHGQGYVIQVLTGARAFPAADDIAFIEVLKAQSFKHWQLIDTESANEWLNVIGNARLLVSGRFHHSIAAAFLRTPFIALNSNTPKMDGLMQMLHLSPPISYATENLLEKLVLLATDLLANSNVALLDAGRATELRKLSLVNFAFMGRDARKH